jgi:hypothetical protein
VAVRYFWGVYSSRKLQAAIDELVAAGEPLYLDDFRPEPVPEHLNVVPVLENILDNLGLTGDEEAALKEARSTDDAFQVPGGEQVASVQSILESKAAVLHSVRGSQRRAAVDWSGTWAESFKTSRIGEYVQLIDLLWLAAADAHYQGDDTEALKLIADMRHVGDALGETSSLLGAMIQSAAYSRSAQLLLDIATNRCAGRRIENIKLSSDVRDMTEETIRSLLDQKSLRRNFVKAMQRDRSVMFENAQKVIAGGLNPKGSQVVALDSLERMVYKPAFELDCVRLLHDMSLNVKAARAESYPSAQNDFNSYSVGPTRRHLQLRAHTLSALMMPALRGHYENAFARRTWQSLVSAATAACLYKHSRVQAIPRVQDPGIANCFRLRFLGSQQRVRQKNHKTRL